MIRRALRPSPALRRVAFPLAAGAVVWLALGGRALAAPPDPDAKKGLDAAKRGDCVTAVPLLEEAELRRHSPTVAFALAKCYLATGELIRASELFHAIAEEPPAKGFTANDRKAVTRAEQEAAEVDARIPTVVFELADAYDRLRIEVDGRVVKDPSEPRQILPDTKIPITAFAPGYKELKQSVVLPEGERRIVRIELERGKPDPAEALSKNELPPDDKPPPPPPDAHPAYLGAKFRGFLIPQFVMNAFADGGDNVIVPGAALTLSKPFGNVDLVTSLGYTSFRLGETPFKGSGTPDTEWEIVESDLQALSLNLELMGNFPLDADGDVIFRFGGGIGVGWMFLGDMYRTQAFPPDDAGGDPYLYVKCRGPNDPDGSFRYCNELDKDKDRYPGYVEPSWFDGGARPAIYPWAAFPELGLSFRASKSVLLDVEAGLSLTGVMLGFGGRLAL